MNCITAPWGDGIYKTAETVSFIPGNSFWSPNGIQTVEDVLENEEVTKKGVETPDVQIGIRQV